MQGKILSVDIADNSAVLSDEEDNHLSFSLDDCVGFDELPRVGEFVKYGMNGGEIFFVEPLSIDYDSRNDFSNEDVSYERTPQKDYIQPKEKKKSQDIQFNIPVTVPLKQCIDEYFEDITYSIHQYEAQFEDYEELDYILMKRFLNTAYNNLSDMDSTFMDEELSELRSDLNALDKIYTNLIKKDGVPQIAFEKIFLDRQIVYKTNKKRLDTNTSEIFTLESSLKSLERYINDIEKTLSEYVLSKEIIEEKKKELKRHRTYYVDSLHKLANIKSENVKLLESTQSFQKKYEEAFILLFEEESQKKYAFLRRQLDGYAYVFDQMMWEKAEKSSSILSFFKKAHIEDEFSSKTFLKYFIKTLDEAKMSKELRKLQELLWYLESRAKLRVLLVEENSQDRNSLKHLIRSFDKEYSVDSIDKPRSVYYRNNLKDLDLIFVDYNIKNPQIIEFLEMLKVRLKQTKSNAMICVMSKKITKEMLINLKKIEIENILSLSIDKNTLEKNIKNIIDSL